eukprot:829178_1
MGATLSDLQENFPSNFCGSNTNTNNAIVAEISSNKPKSKHSTKRSVRGKKKIQPQESTAKKDNEVTTSNTNFQLQKALEHMMYSATKGTQINTELPLSAISSQELISQLESWSEYETKQWNGDEGYSSGAIYHGGQQLIDLQNKVNGLFAISNPLHPTTFPFVRKMMSEIIAMTISYFNGDPYKQCGLITSGGTESIAMAVRTFKNMYYTKHKNNINIKNKTNKCE